MLSINRTIFLEENEMESEGGGEKKHTQQGNSRIEKMQRQREAGQTGKARTAQSMVNIWEIKDKWLFCINHEDSRCFFLYLL